MQLWIQLSKITQKYNLFSVPQKNKFPDFKWIVYYKIVLKKDSDSFMVLRTRTGMSHAAWRMDNLTFAVPIFPVTPKGIKWITRTDCISLVTMTIESIATGINISFSFHMFNKLWQVLKMVPQSRPLIGHFENQAWAAASIAGWDGNSYEKSPIMENPKVWTFQCELEQGII